MSYTREQFKADRSGLEREDVNSEDQQLARFRSTAAQAELSDQEARRWFDRCRRMTRSDMGETERRLASQIDKAKRRLDRLKLSLQDDPELRGQIYEIAERRSKKIGRRALLLHFIYWHDEGLPLPSWKDSEPDEPTLHQKRVLACGAYIEKHGVPVDLLHDLHEHALGNELGSCERDTFYKSLQQVTLLDGTPVYVKQEKSGKRHEGREKETIRRIRQYCHEQTGE